MSEEGLHIDTHAASTGESKPVELEHSSEQVKEDSEATATMDPETPSESEETEDSAASDDSDKIIDDLSPTTPIHTDHREDGLEKDDEEPPLLKPAEHETDADKHPQELSLSEEAGTNAEQPNEAAANETSIAAIPGPEQLSDEPTPDPSPFEESKEDEATEQHRSIPVEGETPIDDALSRHASPAAAETEDSGEKNLEEDPEDARGPSITEVDGASEEIIPDTSHPAETKPEPTLEEETRESPKATEEKVDESTDKKLSLPTSVELETPAELTTQDTQAATKLEAPTADQTIPEAPKEPAKATPSDREKRSLNAVNASRNQFRAALDVFLQVIYENEDDEGIIRLNLVDRDSDVRKAVGMLGLRLQSLTDAERELDWAQLLDKCEAKKGKE